MSPGYLQIAGGYYMIESGSCGDGLESEVRRGRDDLEIILRKSECEAAATALDLSYKTAFAPPGWSDYRDSRSPPGCVFHATGHLSIMGMGPALVAHWACSSLHKCICKSYSYDSYSYGPTSTYSSSYSYGSNAP